MSKRHYLLILLGLGLLTRFIFFGQPNETVFDEVHFGKFISGYYTHEYFFDIHPPLGKLMIAGFAKIFNFKPEFAFGEIGEPYPDKQYMILRFLPSLAGALLPLVIYLLAPEMGFAPLYAFVAGLFIVLDNALLTQSIYILMDAFLLLFGFSALLFYFKFRKSTLHNTYYILLFGFFSGLAISVKWTGLGFLALPLAFEFFSMIKAKNFKGLISLTLPVITAFLLYFSFFATHLKILVKSGPGDAFMSQGFQKTLTGNKIDDLDPTKEPNLIQKFLELNFEMYKANQGLTATHPYSSPWYSWPFMARPIYYWVNQDARIYLIGNPFIWLASTTAVILLVFKFIQNTRYKIQDTTAVFLLSGYIVNILPFIGVKRVLFLYHYFSALIFAILILVYLMNEQKSSKRMVGALLTLSAITFLFFAPLNYGLELSPKAYESRVWFESWR